jgi:hypothetical protein
MSWRAAVQDPRVSGPACPGLPEPDANDPYAEKRRRAVELLGERYVLHSARVLHRTPAATGGARAILGAAVNRQRGDVLNERPCPIGGQDLRAA